MSDKIDDIINEAVGKEGRYSNDPKDPGGETMWGVTIAVARRYGYIGRMVDMPRSTAQGIYRQEYVVEPGFDAVIALSPRIAAELVEQGINMGQVIPGRHLQRALNLLNNQATDYPDIPSDGTVGVRTLGAMQAFLRSRGSEGEEVLLRMLNAQQCVRYMDIAEGRPASERYEYGWIRARVVL